MKKEIPKHKLVERRGIYYEVDSIVPFTGSTIEYCIVKKTELKKRENYKNGKPHGRWEEFNENGQLKSKENYKNGKPHGFWDKYYDNGKLEVRERYKDGQFYGQIEIFDENGQLSWKGYPL